MTIQTSCSWSRPGTMALAPVPLLLQQPQEWHRGGRIGERAAVFQQAGYGGALWVHHPADDSCTYANDGMCDDPQQCSAGGLILKVNCTDACTDGTGAPTAGRVLVTARNNAAQGSGLRQADFGPRLYDYVDGIQAALAIARPLGACTPLTNAAELVQRLVLVTVSSALLSPAKACTVVTMATNIPEARGLGMLVLSSQYHLYSDDTTAAAASRFPRGSYARRPIMAAGVTLFSNNTVAATRQVDHQRLQRYLLANASGLLPEQRGESGCIGSCQHSRCLRRVGEQPHTEHLASVQQV